MSVNQDKTLVKVRTFAKDFAEHNPGSNHPVATTEPEQAIPPKPKKEMSIAAPVGTTIKQSPHIAIKNEPIKVSTQQPEPKKSARPKRKKKKVNLNDLQKEIEQVQQTPTAEPKIEPKKETVAHSTPSHKIKDKPTRVPTGPATVITATKRSEGRASSHSIIDQIIAWFKEMKKRRQRKKTPTYTVEQTSRRKGVIQKATTKSGALFTADNETLREAILRRRGAQAHELDVNWSPNTDVGYNLLESPEAHKNKPHNVQVAFRKRTTTPAEVTQPPEPQPKPEPVPDQKSVLPPTPVPKIVPPLAPEKIEPVQEPVPPPVTEPEPPQPKPEPVTTPAPQPVKETRTASSATPSLLQRIRFSDLSTNALTMLAIGIIATMVLAVLVGRAMYGLFVPETPIVTVEPSSPILAGVTVLDIKLANDSREGLFTAIEQTDTFAQAPIQEFRFKHTDGTLITPFTMVNLLGLELAPSFTQSIEKAHLVLTNHTHRGILLTVSDPITAFGGMLEWEKSMHADLSEVFDSLATATTSVEFYDEIYGQTDVRILTDESETLIIYGFIDPNTILITDNNDSFRQVLETGTVY